MNKTVTYYGRAIEAGEDTPLTIRALAQFFNCGHCRIYADIERGYTLEFGNETTPGHYRNWLRNNPRPRKSAVRAKSQADALRLERELSQLQ